MSKPRQNPSFFPKGGFMIGKILRDIRAFNKVTLTQISNEWNISQGYLSEIELGKKEPTLDVIHKYSQKFNIPVSSIMFFMEHHGEPEIIKKFRKITSNGVVKLFDYLLDKQNG
jgi:transcriptional regulator with XRE-family HTH domain